jgi:hypothetical protein
MVSGSVLELAKVTDLASATGSGLVWAWGSVTVSGSVLESAKVTDLASATGSGSEKVWVTVCEWV